MKPERNAAAEPQTEARRACGTMRMPARDERTSGGVERVRSRGDEPATRETQQNRALVTAEKSPVKSRNGQNASLIHVWTSKSCLSS